MVAVTENPYAPWPTYVVHNNRATAQRKVQIAYADIDDMVACTFPPASVVGSAIIWGLGAPFPARPWLRATKMSIKPTTNRMTGTDAFNQIVYDEADCTIDYETPRAPLTQAQADADGDPVPGLHHRVTIGGEFLTLPETALEWDEDGKAMLADTNAAKIVVQLEHQITWPNIIRPPFTAIRNSIGKVNDANLNFATGLMVPESALFLGAEVSREIMSSGVRGWTLSYRFSERQVIAEDSTGVANPAGGKNVAGWNHFWRQERAKHGFYRLRRKQTVSAPAPTGYDEDTAIFLKVDMSKLFEPEP